VEFAQLSFSIAGALFTALFVAVARQRRPDYAATVFLAAVAASAAWAWCSLAALLTHRSMLGIASWVLDLLRYGLWFAWLLLQIMPPGERPGNRQRTAFLAIAAGLLSAPFLLPLFAVTGIVPAEWARQLAPALALALPVFGLMLIEQLYRNTSEDGRWTLKPLTIGLGLMFVFDVYVYAEASLFGHADANSLSIRAALHACSVPLLLIAHARQNRPDARLRISRSAAFHSAALVLVGGYLLFLSAVALYMRTSGGSWGSALQIGMLFVGAAMLAALVLSESVRAELRVFIAKHFISYRYDYRAEWLRFTRMLSTSGPAHQVGEVVVRGLASMVESPGGAVWERTLDGQSFAQTAAWNMPRVAESEPADGPLARFLAEKDWVLDLAEHSAHPQRYDGIVLPAWLRTLHDAWLVVPLFVVDVLAGFVVIARPRTPLHVDWEVRDLLKTASRQAAGFLAQMHATGALLEARKFEAFNRMSAFVVHDLKNIVTQLSLMMKNARRLHDNPEFQRDMLETIEHAVEKMRQLMVQLREGERATDGVSGVPIAPIVRRLAAAAEQRGRQVALELGEEISTRGLGDRLERVLGHVLQNALDATASGGRVWMKLERAGGRARVVVGDSGAGMTAEFVQTSLFRPFSTTKASGMGIGAYESYRYVRELGGAIDVDSGVGRGTVIAITLPLFDAHERSDVATTSAR
jgi:putative PEP-CTERM system histidine kinase